MAVRHLTSRHQRCGDRLDFLLLLELGKVARKHCVQQRVGARLAKVARLASRLELLY
jgi:hypothetical protein